MDSDKVIQRPTVTCYHCGRQVTDQTRTKTEATIEDLYRVRGQAEIVDGELRLMSPTGGLLSRAARKICASLLAYERGASTDGG